MIDENENTVVSNRIFWGIEDICQNMFNNHVRPDLLRRWISYAGFPAPRMLKSGNTARVTTWGLLESWLIMLYDAEMTTEKADRERSFNKLWTRKASDKLKSYYLNGMTNEEAKELVEAAERWASETPEGRWRKAHRIHHQARWHFEQRYGFKWHSPPQRERYNKITIEFPPTAKTLK